MRGRRPRLQGAEGVELVIPDVAEAIEAAEGETPEATAETPDAGETAKAQAGRGS